MKPFLRSGVALLALVLAAAYAQTNEALSTNAAQNTGLSLAGLRPPVAPPLTRCLEIKQDPAGKILQDSFVWADLPGCPGGVAVGMRKTFELKEKPGTALVHLLSLIHI